jgi:hypothetical protein
MKKVILSMLMIAIIAICGHTQNLNIPDANFKSALVSNNAINTNGDTEIQVTEAVFYLGTINVSNQFIFDITGIEAFINVTEINIGSNFFTAFPAMSSNELTHLYCGNNLLTSLDVSGFSNLELLYCGQNDIVSLDLTANSNIKYLKCDDNDLTSLDLRNGNNSDILQIWMHTNPTLSCVAVDDIDYVNTNWFNSFYIKDNTTNYSETCAGTGVLVSSISVQGQGGASTITNNAGTLQIEATVLPANADDATYTWSVTNGTGTATINAGGILTAITNGTIDVIATANDGSGVTGSATITISNQTIGIDEKNGLSSGVEIYPNPVKNQLFIDGLNGQINQLVITDYSGKVVLSINDTNTKNINVSELNQGIYILKISTNKGIATKQFIKK